jgi:hypothetical protein
MQDVHQDLYINAERKLQSMRNNFKINNNQPIYSKFINNVNLYNQNFNRISPVVVRYTIKILIV